LKVGRVILNAPSPSTSEPRRVKDNAPDPQTATVQIKGLDIHDPIKDEVKSRDVNDIAYWMVDNDYDGANFIVRLYGHQSHPFKIRDGQRIAVRVISQFGEETPKVPSVQPQAESIVRNAPGGVSAPPGQISHHSAGSAAGRDGAGARAPARGNCH
jgi:hypothetical protein